ncbi:two-component system, NtrC family, response regulator [Ferrimonas sediminum]|uniref:Two-component system, NtrC family, response regulator n=1 Tax=Ferrimonas sediminum TaxID=718193 RepID=A0A1G8LV60_9GAMM|nr:sigma-54 dependent transcriptional regulator [Ferrimonas sediminum]SDI59367.1 two-component system, NtrC family, response regulator [Ferrimonas sediminum]
MSTSNGHRILLLEDDDTQRELLQQMLQQAGHQVAAVADADGAWQQLIQGQWQILFSDWKLARGDASAVIARARSRFPTLGIIVATAYGSIDHAVEAIKIGADDYLPKPFQKPAMLLAIDKVARQHRLKEDNQRLSSQLQRHNQLLEMVGGSAVMTRLYQRIERISAINTTVLIQGESGTGKELVAQAIHRLSQRHGAFIALNCGAIPESLAESELFGHEKGAFTGAAGAKAGKLEAAQGGTLFLDEIGELPLTLQTRLLRVLQEGRVTRIGSHKEIELDIRVVAATNRDLLEEVQAQRFRQDLYYRLNVIPVSLPPLQQRREDIPSLAEHFLCHFSEKYQQPKPRLSAAELTALEGHDWPGNVRELSNCMERFVLLQELDLQPIRCQGSIELPEAGLNWESIEKGYLQAALDRAGGNRSEAARLLGLGYKAFLYRAEKYGLGQ